MFTEHNRPLYTRAAALSEGNTLPLTDTLNTAYDGLELCGSSEQKANWSQAEGETSQEETTAGQGKNKFDKSKYLKMSDYTLPEGASYTYAEIPLEPDKTYTVSVIRSDGFDGTGYGYLLISDVNWINHDYTAVAHQTDGSTNNSPYTVDSSGKLYIGYHASYYAMTQEKLDYIWAHTDVQIEEGTSATEYETYMHDSPSPEYPSEMTSIIPAGSYQIPTENGIYEVTLTEDLYGIDDTYRNMIRFDSVSGKGYLEKMCGQIVLDETMDYGIHIAFNRGDYIAFYEIQNDMRKEHLTVNLMSDRYPAMNAYQGNAYTGNVIYQYGESTFNSFVLKTDKKLLSSPDVNGFKAWLADNPVTVIYKLVTPVKSPLTFTKVENSTAPVLPWTAYGDNLWDFKSWAVGYAEATVNSIEEFDGRTCLKIIGGTASYPLVTFPEYVNHFKMDAYFVGYERSCFTMKKDGTDVYYVDPSVQNEWFSYHGTETFNQIQIYASNNANTPVYIDLDSVVVSVEDIPYEPFNPTPEESLTLSPDYPRQIYGLTDVTVTSRGRNLFDLDNLEGNINTNDRVELTRLKSGYIFKVVSYNKNQWAWQKNVNPIKLEPNTNYTLSFDFAVLQGTFQKMNIGFGVNYAGSGNLHYLTRAYLAGVSWDQEKTTRLVTFNSGSHEAGYFVILSNADTTAGENVAQITNLQLLKGSYTAETIPPYDRYRCTEGLIPLVQNKARALEISQELYESLPYGFGKYQENGKYYVCDYVQARNGSVQYVKCITEETLNGTVSFGESGENRFFSGGFAETFEKDDLVYCASTHLPGITHAQAFYNQAAGVSKMDGVISVAKQGIFADMTAEEFNAWLVRQNSLGMPLTVYSVLKTPIQTDYTSQSWARALLKLATAQYDTQLSADKPAGCLRVLYKSLCRKDSGAAVGLLRTAQGNPVQTKAGEPVTVF